MNIDPNAPAFPQERIAGVNTLGLTIRQHFALELAKGIVSNPAMLDAATPQGIAWVSEFAICQADALIAELNKEGK